MRDKQELPQIINQFMFKFYGAFLMERAIATEQPLLQYADFANGQQHRAATGDVRLFLLIVGSV